MAATLALDPLPALGVQLLFVFVALLLGLTDLILPAGAARLSARLLAQRTAERGDLAPEGGDGRVGQRERRQRLEEPALERARLARRAGELRDEVLVRLPGRLELVVGLEEEGGRLLFLRVRRKRRQGKDSRRPTCSVGSVVVRYSLRPELERNVRAALALRAPSLS